MTNHARIQEFWLVGGWEEGVGGWGLRTALTNLFLTPIKENNTVLRFHLVIQHFSQWGGGSRVRGASNFFRWELCVFVCVCGGGGCPITSSHRNL